jgi:hypothetical protein
MKQDIQRKGIREMKTTDEIRALLDKIKAGTLKGTKDNFNMVGEVWTDLIIWTQAFKPLSDAGLFAPDQENDELFTEESQQILEAWLAQACSVDPEEARKRLRKERERMVNDVIEGRI